MTPTQTLTETLAALGYQHIQSDGLAGALGAHDIVAASGEVVFTGSASEVWAWLRESGQVAP